MKPFSLTTAQEMAYFSQWVYSCHPKDQDGANYCVTIEPSHHAALFRTPTRRVLAFRGSYEVKDWLTNLDALLESGVRPNILYGGSVHAGFHSLLDSLWGWVLDAVNKPSSFPLDVTGHSLGGALVTLGVKRLAARQVPLGDIYTFGSPRVLSHRAARYALPQYRIIHDLDIVPHIPLAWPYKHTGTVVLLQDGQVFQGGTWSHLFKSLVRRCWKAPKLEVQDHYISNYIAALSTPLREVSL